MNTYIKSLTQYYIEYCHCYWSSYFETSHKMSFILYWLPLYTPYNNYGMPYWSIFSIYSTRIHVKINFFVMSLTPKLNTHRKWGIIPKRKSSCIYSCSSSKSILNFKAVAKLFALFFKNQNQKTHVEIHEQNPGMIFQKWWIAVESKTVKTQSSQKHVTSTIKRFQNSMQYLHDSMLHWYFRYSRGLAEYNRFGWIQLVNMGLCNLKIT